MFSGDATSSGGTDDAPPHHQQQTGLTPWLCSTAHLAVAGVLLGRKKLLLRFQVLHRSGGGKGRSHSAAAPAACACTSSQPAPPAPRTRRGAAPACSARLPSCAPAGCSRGRPPGRTACCGAQVGKRVAWAAEGVGRAAHGPCITLINAHKSKCSICTSQAKAGQASSLAAPPTSRRRGLPPLAWRDSHWSTSSPCCSIYVLVAAATCPGRASS